MTTHKTTPKLLPALLFAIGLLIPFQVHASEKNAPANEWLNTAMTLQYSGMGVPKKLLTTVDHGEVIYTSGTQKPSF